MNSQYNDASGDLSPLLWSPRWSALKILTFDPTAPRSPFIPAGPWWPWKIRRNIPYLTWKYDPLPTLTHESMEIKQRRYTRWDGSRGGAGDIVLPLKTSLDVNGAITIYSNLWVMQKAVRWKMYCALTLWPFRPGGPGVPGNPLAPWYSKQ